MSRILIVEDEADLQQVLEYHLRRQGFETRLAARGAEALRLARNEPPDLVLLDWMLPDLSGADVCRELKRGKDTARVAVVMLSARNEEHDRITGLEVGADDYVGKPFSLRELTLRIQAILRRGATDARDDADLLENGSILLDRPGHRVQVHGKDVPVTGLELRILALLLERPGRVLRREQLLATAWDDTEDVSERAIDAHVKRLRAKLGPAKERIETVRGIGYRLRDD
ncbi:response regulator [Vulgatibacter incomptus]|uniref:Phosphate regulon transcriptional regulatory protein PhoB (SphR) n=1 Tax=Vulgatibacter incomptus TaxID=1391653 RepID=A0A0K1PG67_9BACT|nr:response regulator transcription factor [Vulgatibacter incomptus]AKU92104.1 Phosphate regulon transcriptional regulatory protein PhoB (SphR) [Vulgatibacter incomptus]